MMSKSYGKLSDAKLCRVRDSRGLHIESYCFSACYCITLHEPSDGAIALVETNEGTFNVTLHANAASFCIVQPEVLLAPSE